jgi:hypothetical protein
MREISLEWECSVGALSDRRGPLCSLKFGINFFKELKKKNIFMCLHGKNELNKTKLKKKNWKNQVTIETAKIQPMVIHPQRAIRRQNLFQKREVCRKVTHM